MHQTQILVHFHKLRPRCQIEDEIVNGDRQYTFTIRKSDAVNAIPGDPCQCTIARGCRRETNAAEALILTNVAYLLEPILGRRYRVAKYLHDGQNVVKNTDAGGYPVWHTAITLRPPSPLRRVGAQKPSAKASQPKKRKQSKEHLQKRMRSMKANPARARISRVGADAV